MYIMARQARHGQQSQRQADGRDDVVREGGCVMNWPRFGLWIMVAAVVFWQMETAYFGFNRVPGSHAELWCDQAWQAAFVVGFAMRYSVTITRRKWKE